MASDARTEVSKRRFYNPELKLQVVGECGQPGASIAAVALKHAINANIVHRWLREHAPGGTGSSAAFVSACHFERGARAVILCDTVTATRHPHRSPPGKHHHRRELAPTGWRLMRRLAARVVAMIRIDAVWLATTPLDMRAGTDTALARVVQVFGAAPVVF